MTVWAAVLDPVSRRLTYASAGHNPPRLLRGGSVLALGAASGVPLGIDPVAERYTLPPPADTRFNVPSPPAHAGKLGRLAIGVTRHQLNFSAGQLRNCTRSISPSANKLSRLPPDSFAGKPSNLKCSSTRGSMRPKEVGSRKSASVCPTSTREPGVSYVNVVVTRV
jgi:Stage II sporulation protein E (SpoIIE)